MKYSVILLLVISIMVSAPSSSHAAKRGILYSASIGLGAGLPTHPEGFKDNWDPSFGLLLDVGAAKSIVELSVSLDYNFFMSNSQEPVDANVLALFANAKIKPVSKTSIRPYILIGGGYFRYWIVDLDVYDNSLGYGGGAGVELEISEEQRLFIEVKNIFGRTRTTNVKKANTEYIPLRLGLTFVF